MNVFFTVTHDEVRKAKCTHKRRDGNMSTATFSLHQNLPHYYKLFNCRHCDGNKILGSQYCKYFFLFFISLPAMETKFIHSWWEHSFVNQLLMFRFTVGGTRFMRPSGSARYVTDFEYELQSKRGFQLYARALIKKSL